MDFFTLFLKIRSGQILNTASFEQHVRLVLNNAMLFNEPNGWVFASAVLISKLFEAGPRVTKEAPALDGPRMMAYHSLLSEPSIADFTSSVYGIQPLEPNEDDIITDKEIASMMAKPTTSPLTTMLSRPPISVSATAQLTPSSLASPSFPGSKKMSSENTFGSTASQSQSQSQSRKRSLEDSSVAVMMQNAAAAARQRTAGVAQIDASQLANEIGMLQKMVNMMNQKLGALETQFSNRMMQFAQQADKEFASNRNEIRQFNKEIADKHSELCRLIQTKNSSSEPANPLDGFSEL
jgi:hypothetical protein